MKRSPKYLSTTATYFIVAAVLLTLFFQLWRLILLLATSNMAEAVPSSVLVQSFLVGLRFDFAVTSYIMLPLVLFGMLPFIDISRSKIARWINFVLLIILSAAAFFANLVDIEFFRFFNTRLNGTALLWKDEQSFMFSMIWDMYPVVRYFLLYFIILAVFIILARWALRRLIVHLPQSPVWANLVYMILLIAMFVIGARGRIEEKSPLRWGVAYFSEYDYANQLALNPTFTFLSDAVRDAGSGKQARQLMEEINDPQAETITRRMLGLPDSLAESPPSRIYRSVRFDPSNDNPPNVILIIMESFGSTRIGTLGNRLPYDLSPHFDSLANDGICFTNVYSTGMHTYAGLFSTLYGYPPVFGNLIMKQASGKDHFWGLPHILREHGYRTMFFTTHDPHFDNMQGFLMANGVDKVYSMFDWDPSERVSTLGVPDHLMFDHAIDVFRNLSGARFFATLLTGSNHGPWIIPDVEFERVPESEHLHKSLNAFKYSDWALGRFVRTLESNPAFENTLVVVTADNGILYEPVADMDLTQYQIPLLFYWIGNNRPAPERIDRLGGQLDIVATVMGQLHLDYENYTFGRDLLDSTDTIAPFAHFSEWYNIGYIEDQYYLITRIGGPESLYRLSDPMTNLTDSLHDLMRGYRRKALAFYQTAYHNMQLPLRPPKR